MSMSQSLEAVTKLFYMAQKNFQMCFMGLDCLPGLNLITSVSTVEEGSRSRLDVSEEWTPYSGL
jgi:hypothetical protein